MNADRRNDLVRDPSLGDMAHLHMPPVIGDDGSEIATNVDGYWESGVTSLASFDDTLDDQSLYTTLTNHGLEELVNGVPYVEEESQMVTFSNGDGGGAANATAEASGRILEAAVNRLNERAAATGLKEEDVAGLVEKLLLQQEEQRAKDHRKVITPVAPSAPAPAPVTQQQQQPKPRRQSADSVLRGSAVEDLWNSSTPISPSPKKKISGSGPIDMDDVDDTTSASSESSNNDPHLVISSNKPTPTTPPAKPKSSLTSKLRRSSAPSTRLKNFRKSITATNSKDTSKDNTKSTAAAKAPQSKKQAHGQKSKARRASAQATMTRSPSDLWNSIPTSSTRGEQEKNKRMAASDHQPKNNATWAPVSKEDRIRNRANARKALVAPSLNRSLTDPKNASVSSQQQPQQKPSKKNAGTGPLQPQQQKGSSNKKKKGGVAPTPVSPRKEESSPKQLSPKKKVGDDPKKKKLLLNLLVGGGKDKNKGSTPTTTGGRQSRKQSSNVVLSSNHRRLVEF